jgi:hypothetical protein
MLLRVEVNDRPIPTSSAQQKVLTNRQSSEDSATAGKKVGRNEPCPCGAIDPATGKVYKYKKCGLISAPHHKA